MKKIAANLKQNLKDSDRIAILAIGSYLKGDDAAGVIAGEQIQNSLGNSSKIKVFIGATAPENLTGEIKNYNPSHLIVIDAADLNISPGEMKIIYPEDIGGTSFSTHSLPIKLIIDYLRLSCNCEFIFIGIQPKTLEGKMALSKEVKQAVDEFTETIVSLDK